MTFRLPNFDDPGGSRDPGSLPRLRTGWRDLCDFPIFRTDCAALQQPFRKVDRPAKTAPNRQVCQALAALTLLAALATPALAQRPKPPTTHDRSIAAGYKALTLCSGIFNGGRTQAQVEALDLTGIYPEYDAIVPTLKANVDRDFGAVSVAYDDKMPPRRAEWGLGRGCTILPPGAIDWPRSGDVRPLGYRPAADFQKPDPRLWPLGDATPRIAPDPRLTQLSAAAFTPLYGEKARTVGVLIMQDGKLLAERYADGFGPFTANRTWSVAKSIAGTLTGIAVKQGLTDLAAPANIPEWGPWPRGDRRRTITLDNLLRMASGLYSDTAGNRTDAVYFGGTRVTEETTGWPLETLPNTRFRYANNDILLATRSLRASLGEDLYRYFPLEALFRPLGMRHTVAEQDVGGNYILSSQVWSTARDFARLGQFWLQDGVWNGERILPEGWMTTMTTPSGPQPAVDTGYGATLWLHGPKTGLPEGSYAAQGNRGQYIVVIPSAKLVIVRRGEDPAGGGEFEFTKFAADVVKELGDRP